MAGNERMNAVPMREFEGEPYVKRLHCEFPANFVRLAVEPEVHRQISLVTVAGRPHSKPVALAIKAAKTYAWVRQGPGSETAGQAGTA